MRETYKVSKALVINVPITSLESFEHVWALLMCGQSSREKPPNSDEVSSLRAIEAPTLSIRNLDGRGASPKWAPRTVV